jgi:hypothetical protein
MLDGRDLDSNVNGETQTMDTDQDQGLVQQGELDCICHKFH